MRFTAGLTLAALAGLAASSGQEADVFLFNTEQPYRGPKLSKDVAGHIMLQRTTSSRHGFNFRDVVSTPHKEIITSFFTRYGKGQPSLFQDAKREPLQLVVILQGITDENAKPLRDVLSQTHDYPSFRIDSPPSTLATAALLDDFRAAGVANDFQCDFELVVNPFDKTCWKGPSAVVWYDAQKRPEIIDTMTESLERLKKFTSNGDLEALVVLLPESSRSSDLDAWIPRPAAPASTSHDSASDLRRRDEAVIAESEEFFESKRPVTASSSGNSPAPHAWAQAKAIPQCFTTETSCASQTSNCSGHGECINKYGNGSKTVCFVCACKSSVEKTNSTVFPLQTIQWGGSMCQKEDISAQFWLLAGFSVAIVGAVSFAIGLLFSVGEEKLPGVIGAGVSRSK